jgi:DNA replication and repair protein RecF
VSLQRLRIENVRCIAQAELEFDARCTLISGPNASGKTTLLESIFLLGRGRSFRTLKLESLIRGGSSTLRVVGRTSSGQHVATLGVEARREGLRARVDGRNVTSLVELAVALPVQSVDPDVHRLIEGGPAERRRFLDWGVFHVEPQFVGSWRRFQRALKQRNAALRTGARSAEVRAWDPDFLEAGAQVARHRAEYVSTLSRYVQDVGRRLLNAEIELEFRPGWSAEHDLNSALAASWSRDLERQQTHIGPHRAELVIRLNRTVARGQVSRGQQKLLASALLLGQLQCDAERGSKLAVLLVDDPAAELDSAHLRALLDEIRALRSQLVVTALEPQNTLLESLSPARRFHVEHGEVTGLV